jgi:hypothetical protein
VCVLVIKCLLISCNVTYCCEFLLYFYEMLWDVIKCCYIEMQCNGMSLNVICCRNCDVM